MKKLVLTSLLAVFTASAASAGSYFVGGSAGLEAAKGDDNTVWYVAPELGYHLNDKLDLGLSAGFGYTNNVSIVDNSLGFGPGIDAYAYGVEGFARYKVAEFGGFKLLLKGSVGVDFVTFDDGDDNTTLSMLNADVTPMVTYDVTPSFTLYANLNFLGAHFGQQFKNDDLEIDNNWKFSIGADTSDVLNTGDFQIGFYYNF